MQTNSRDRLLEAARRLFVSEGYNNTSMDLLCASVGLTRGALYHQFGGKEGLFEQVVEKMDQEILMLAKRAVSGLDDPVERMREGNRVYLRLMTNAEYQRILLCDAPAVLGRAERQMYRQCQASMASNLAELMDLGVLSKERGRASGMLLTSGNGS